MGILIRGGRIVDAAAKIDRVADIYLNGGVVEAVGENLKVKEKDDRIIDASGLVVLPGLVDHMYISEIRVRHRRKI